jgi:hypothetical protein
VENIEESRDKVKGREKGEKLKEKKSPSQSKERAMGILNEMFVHTFGLGSVVGVSLVCVPDRVSRPSDAPATSTARAHGYRDRIVGPTEDTRVALCCTVYVAISSR